MSHSSTAIVDTQYLVANIVPLFFFMWVNSYTTYLFVTNTFVENQLKFVVAIGFFEFFNTFYELSYTKINKEFVLHHVVATTNMYLIYVYYNEKKYVVFFNDFIYLSVMMLCSSLYLVIQSIFPQYIIPKIAFVSSFFTYRFGITFPFMLKLAIGDYYIDDWVLKTIVCNGLIIYLLSIYWGFKILKILCKTIQIVRFGKQNTNNK